MLVAAILIPLFAFALLGLVNVMVPKEERARILGVFLAGYFVRLVLFLVVMRSVAFFSHGHAGGDCEAYQILGSMVASLWHSTGIHFVTSGEFFLIGQAGLLINTLALMEYVGGEASPLGGVALNAFFACWTVLIFYRFVLDEGVERRTATIMSALLLFGPSFLYHTSDTYKDGLNAFFVLASILGSIRLSKQFTWFRLAALGASLLGLWFIRHYMVFMCLVPLALGLLGGKEASATRRVIAFFMVTALAGAAAGTGALGSVFGAAEATFEHATSAGVLAYNQGAHGQYRSAIQGSGIITDSYWVRLVYTVFAPFPWQGGSFGLQLGKLEALTIYYFMWLVVPNRKALWRDHRSTTLMVLAFVIPATLAYAATMSNIGLIVRQRMPIVMMFAVLATIALSESRERRRLAALRARDTEDRPRVTGARTKPAVPPRLGPPIPATSVHLTKQGLAR